MNEFRSNAPPYAMVRANQPRPGSRVVDSGYQHDQWWMCTGISSFSCQAFLEPRRRSETSRRWLLLSNDTWKALGIIPRSVACTKNGTHAINWENNPVISLPIFTGPYNWGHFSLLVVDRTHCSADLFLYFDSLPSMGKDIAIGLQHKLRSSPLCKDGSIFKSMINPIKLMPLQSRGPNDYGIFTCCSAAAYLMYLQQSEAFAEHNRGWVSMGCRLRVKAECHTMATTEVRDNRVASTLRRVCEPTRSILLTLHFFPFSVWSS
jgi:hypothetical protein